MNNLLRNGDFEADWSEERSHQTLRIPVGGQPETIEVGNIFTPPGWLVWFKHQEGEWAQPEARDARDTSPARMHGGEKGYLIFTFSRRQDAGLLQQANVTPGTRVRFSIWAHAWSNHKDPAKPDRFPHPDDPTWSEGAGFDPFFGLEGTLSGNPNESDLSNFTFWVGIDPAGGRNPFAESVVWGQGAHIYNAFAQVPAVETRAEAGTITLFTRALTQFPFKHNDAYWDDAELITVGETPPPPPPPPADRGKPRIQYERLYVLLPPGANKEWARAVVESTWDDHRYTVGGSADDAGIGDLDSRIVLAVNPEQWGGPDVLRGFFAEHYPGVRYRTVKAATPAELAELLKNQ
ncbi:MAG: hypothetical protein L0332_15540 [Chloroflexi bacterium]|nr:hypothetical protein [Chloroflexota bacterium]MCI0579703.1 hypothetical protein [Chloroflexota bacterium]MCI0644136.1 hypothetical protein [Chloroflexota bacterium]MCI0728116.1 hypothetical protein [Chloroflexota bacterium]